MLDPATEFKEHQWPYEVDHRGAEPGGAAYFGQGKPFGYFATTSGGWQLDGEPYTVAEGSQFRWFRSRIIGGRTNHYGRMSFRFSDYDFKPYSRDGLGWDWPISYDDIAPYYDKVERLVGLFGTNEGLENDPDGIFLPPPTPRCYELLVKKAADSLGLRCIPSRLSIIKIGANQDRCTDGKTCTSVCPTGALKFALDVSTTDNLRRAADPS